MCWDYKKYINANRYSKYQDILLEGIRRYTLFQEIYSIHADYRLDIQQYSEDVFLREQNEFVSKSQQTFSQC